MKNLFVLTMLVLCLSCKETTKKSPTEKELKIEAANLSELKLDNGNKWIANIETHKGVQNMASIITAFNTNSEKDYVALGNSLSEQTSYIIKKCSMKGEPHNQLDVVLVPMLDAIGELKESSSESDGQQSLNQLNRLIKIYFKHFKIN